MNTPTTHESLADLHKKVDRLAELIQAIMPRKSARAMRQADLKTANSPALHKRRVATVEDLFIKMIDTPLRKRRDVYRFPKPLLERPDQPTIQGMLMSVLLNHAALRKTFAPVAGEAGKTAAQIAEEALKDSNLCVVRMCHTTLQSINNTFVVLSPAAVQQFVRDRSLWPKEWRGWSCEARVGITNSGVGPLDPPDDPSGVRVWEGDEAAVNESEADIDGDDEDLAEDYVEPLAPAPKKRRVDFSSVEDEKPKRKVSFSTGEGARKPVNIRVNLDSKK